MFYNQNKEKIENSKNELEAIFPKGEKGSNDFLQEMYTQLVKGIVEWMEPITDEVYNNTK